MFKKSNANEREIIMHAFLNKWLHNYLKINQIKFNYLDALDGDAGFRKYYRVNILDKDNTNKNYILTYAPPSTEKNLEFLNIHNIFYKNNIKVPDIYDYDLEQGFFLIEDLGEKLAFNYIKKFDHIYKVTLDNLVKIQKARVIEAVPEYSSSLMTKELNLCNEWFLDKFLKISHSNFSKDYKVIVNNLQSQAKVLVHRDFQSKNLILSNDLKNVGVIDFQDAVIGPVTYDLASLLYDCYVDIESELFDSNIDYFFQELISNNLIESKISKEIFTDWFYYAVLLRHIKNLGIFARLYLRDNKKQYLQHMPRTLSYVLKALEYFKSENRVENKLEDKLEDKLEELNLVFNTELLSILNNKLEKFNKL